jgi:ATP-binding cassette subfamily F protein 3
MVFVSHDRYFVERLATRIVEVGGGQARLYPGTYAEFLWSKGLGALGAGAGARAEGATGATGATGARGARGARAGRPQGGAKDGSGGRGVEAAGGEAGTYEERKRDQAERRRRDRAMQALRARIADLETRIAELEKAIKSLEAKMAAPGFYDRHDEARPILDEHQALMWKVGDLLGQWEMLQSEADGER